MKCWQIFLELNSKRLYQSSGKEKESRSLVLKSSTKRENTPLPHFPCLPPNILHNLWFSFLLGITAVPREIDNNAYAKFWRANKVHYGKCGSGVLDALSRCSRAAAAKKCTKKGDARAKLLSC